MGNIIGAGENDAHLSIEGDDDAVLACLALDLVDSGKHVDGAHDAVSKLLIHDGLDGLSIVQHSLHPSQNGELA